MHCPLSKAIPMLPTTALAISVTSLEQRAIFSILMRFDTLVQRAMYCVLYSSTNTQPAPETDSESRQHVPFEGYNMLRVVLCTSCDVIFALGSRFILTVLPSLLAQTTAIAG